MFDIQKIFIILAVIIGCSLTIFVAVLEIYLLIFIWEGTWNSKSDKRRGINIDKLISESTGDASLARFQLLIFTFVISMSLVLIVTSNQPPAFPKIIPDQILGLLGISSSSYVLGKALQTQIAPPPTEPPPTEPLPTEPPPSPPPEQHSDPYS